MNSPERNRKQAWHLFYHRQFKRLFHMAKNMKLPKDLIEDAVLQTMLKVYRQWRSTRVPEERCRLQALSRKIMHDTIADQMRRRDRRRAASLHDLPAEPTDGKTRNPADELAAKEMPEWVRATLEELRQLHPHYAWLLDEHFLHERSYEELAVAMGAAKHAIECQMTRAKKAFRRLLEKRGVNGESW